MTKLEKSFKEKIVFLFPDRLSPLDSGAKQVSASILKYFRARGLHVTLISTFMYQPNSSAIQLYCDDLIEVPSVLRAPWWRLLNRINNMGRKNAFSRDLLFRNLMRKYIWQNLRKIQFDAVILNYVQFSDWIPPELKSKTIILTHDIYHRRWASINNVPLDDVSVESIKQFEYQELAKYPLLLTVADYEFDILSLNFPMGKILDIGAPQSVRRCHNDDPVYRFGFVGANAPPNSDGLMYFLQEWWPALRPSRLGIAGAICNNRKVINQTNPSDVTLEGFLDELDKFYTNCRWIIAPLRIGSGVKVKVLEAMARGKVVIGTSKAFEGIPVTHGIDAFILDNFRSAALLAKTIFYIERNPDKFEQMERKASELVQKHFSLESRIDPLVERIKMGAPFADPSR